MPPGRTEEKEVRLISVEWGTRSITEVRIPGDNKGGVFCVVDGCLKKKINSWHEAVYMRNRPLRISDGRCIIIG